MANTAKIAIAASQILRLVGTGIPWLWVYGTPSIRRGHSISAFNEFDEGFGPLKRKILSLDHNSFAFQRSSTQKQVFMMRRYSRHPSSFNRCPGRIANRGALRPLAFAS